METGAIWTFVGPILFVMTVRLTTTTIVVCALEISKLPVRQKGGKLTIKTLNVICNIKGLSVRVGKVCSNRIWASQKAHQVGAYLRFLFK